ncbi:MAG: hypothetical protein KGZ30_01625 [Anaplasmataceae bacterium]|nr:hypothetical protein [Anaplasmataceae bacterium]
MHKTLALLGLIALTIAFGDMISPNGTTTTYANVIQENCRLVKSPKTVLIGEASYYGPGFHGRPTATGNAYDQDDPHKAACLDAFTHTLLRERRKKLTCVEVTNLDNGRKLRVECRDTGSFCEKYGRVIDLSRAGSAFLREGRAATIEKVLVEPVSCDS